MALSVTCADTTYMLKIHAENRWGQRLAFSHPVLHVHGAHLKHGAEADPFAKLAEDGWRVDDAATRYIQVAGPLDLSFKVLGRAPIGLMDVRVVLFSGLVLFADAAIVAVFSHMDDRWHLIEVDHAAPTVLIEPRVR